MTASGSGDPGTTVGVVVESPTGDGPTPASAADGSTPAADDGAAASDATADGAAASDATADGVTPASDAGGALASAVEAAGAEPVVGEAAAVLAAEPDWLLADGDGALSAVARAGADVPVLAVAVAAGLPSVPEGAVEDAVGRVLDGDRSTVERLVFEVSVDGRSTTRSLRDVTLLTDEPARIAEYSIRSGGRRVARFRADGIVVATPAGSRGYASDAGGAVLEAGTGVAAAVPIAPFVTDAAHWVLDAADLTLAVERDVPVALVADGRRWGTVAPDEPVALRPGRPLALLAPGGNWKHSNGERPE